MRLSLPALTLGLGNAAVLARLTRSAMIDIFDRDFQRSGLVPIVAMLGLQVAYPIGGAIAVETVFAWNGAGRVVIEAVCARGYPVIQGLVLFFAIVVALASAIADIADAFLGPPHPAGPMSAETLDPLPAGVLRAKPGFAGALLARPSGVIGLAIARAPVVAALAAPRLAPFGPLRMATGPRLQPPSLDHRMGTEDFGRDGFSRIQQGARLTLPIGAIAVGIARTAGLALGLVAGYAGGSTERIPMRLVDLPVSFAEIVIAPG